MATDKADVNSSKHEEAKKAGASEGTEIEGAVKERLNKEGKPKQAAVMRPAKGAVADAPRAAARVGDGGGKVLPARGGPPSVSQADKRGELANNVSSGTATTSAGLLPAAHGTPAPPPVGRGEKKSPTPAEVLGLGDLQDQKDRGRVKAPWDEIQPANDPNK